jgi:CO dehydrogenase/acetyl-CoA synthase alpha subunit
MFNKMDYISQQITALNRINQFMTENDMDYWDTEQRASVISLLEDLGVEIDACSSCGAMPMESNCNNARCQDN